MLRKINTAVIGVGNMGRHHARVYSELKQATLVAVADVNENVGRKISEKFGCRFYTNYEQMLDSEKVDAISICVPTSLHKDVALACINRRIPILIEKPIAESIEAAKAIISAAKKSKVNICVGHIERFNPVVRALKHLLRTRKLGDITSIHTRRAGPFPHQIFDADVILDLAVHDIDIVSYLLGKTARLIDVQAKKVSNKKRFDYADIFLRYGRVDAVINVDWTSQVKVRKVWVAGKNACAEADYVGQSLKLYPTTIAIKTIRGQDTAKREKSCHREIKISKAEPLKIEIENFLKFAANMKCESVLATDALLTLGIALKAINWARHPRRRLVDNLRRS